MDKKFLKEFVSFFKKEGVYGEYLSEKMILPYRTSDDNRFRHPYEKMEPYMKPHVICYTMLWEGTKRGEDFWCNLNTKWNEQWIKKHSSKRSRNS